MKRKCCFPLLVVLLLLTGYFDASAQEVFPSRPITCIVPFAPGGGTDIVVRALGAVLPKYVGQPVVTMNKFGGGGTLGVLDVVKAKPDGYTILSCGVTITMPELYEQFRKTDYTSKDLTPVARWTNSIAVIAVRKDAPWNTFKDFMQDAKNKGIKFGGPGKTTGNYVYGLALAKKYNVKLAGIPFDGDGKSVPALLGGHIDMGIILVSSAKPHVDAGTLKVLAVLHEERIPTFPNLPTTYEEGYDVGFSSFDIGTYAPVKTPVERIKVLAEAIRKTTQDESFKSTMDKVGEIVVYSDTETFRKRYQATQEAMTKIFKELGYLPN